MSMGLNRAGVVRDGMACLGISPPAPHGKVLLHLKLLKNLFKMACNVESRVG